MEQKAKKYEDLNKYERAMTNASIEQRLEMMAREIAQIAIALKLSVNVDATFHNLDNEHATVCVVLIGDGDNDVFRRDVENEGDVFGVIEEAKKWQETQPGGFW